MPARVSTLQLFARQSRRAFSSASPGGGTGKHILQKQNQPSASGSGSRRAKPTLAYHDTFAPEELSKLATLSSSLHSPPGHNGSIEQKPGTSAEDILERLLRESCSFSKWSSTAGVDGFPGVNSRYNADEHAVTAKMESERTEAAGASAQHWSSEEWSRGDIKDATKNHVMLTWGPTGPASDLPHIVRGDGVYLFDAQGNKYLDWTSQAVCTNLGHSAPQEVIDAVTHQMQTVPFVYSGMGIVDVRARLAQLMAEITPGDINGFLFPGGGAEANEAAIRMARRYTGRQKIMTQYRSYHGGTAQTLGSTGDFRRWFTEAGVNGFVKIFNPQPNGFSLGRTDTEATKLSLQMLEEQILAEGPNNIAAIMLESIVGAGGVLVPPAGYMQGVRNLCDKYDILLILDEVMAGFGRTGKLFAFEHFDGVLPDIITSAKGLTGGFMPLSVVGVREKIKQYFETNPLGWGSTYHAHPVAMAAAYECVKFTLKHQLPQRAADLQAVMMEEMQRLIDNHPSVKQGRVIGLFGCLDLVGADGKALISPAQAAAGATKPEVQLFRRAMRESGLIGLFRPPLLHCCPPLVISEPELRDGFQRLSNALTVLDDAIEEVSQE